MTETSPTSGTDRLQRAVDIVVGSLLAALAVPVILVAAAGSAMSLRAWPFFSQDRVGRDGTTFRFVKVRTLPPTAPAYADKFQLDQRQIPRFCRLLRTLHLDELPQLVLVLSGRMSLVGPRPEMPPLHAALPARFAAERTAVRPGCTGLWQVSDSCAGLIGSAPWYDRFYLRHRTLRMDAWILYRTALKMVRSTSVITLDDVPRWALAPITPAAAVDLPETETYEQAAPAAAGR